LYVFVSAAVPSPPSLRGMCERTCIHVSLNVISSPLPDQYASE